MTDREKIARTIAGTDLDWWSWTDEADAILALFEGTIKDAERYRLARQNPEAFGTASWGHVLNLHKHYITTPEKVDEAFDEAVAAKGAECLPNQPIT